MKKRKKKIPTIEVKPSDVKKSTDPIIRESIVATVAWKFDVGAIIAEAMKANTPPPPPPKQLQTPLEKHEDQHDPCADTTSDAVPRDDG